MTTPAALVQFFEPWARLYSDSKSIATVVVFLHVSAMMFAGGLAITIDRGTLRAAKDQGQRANHLGALAGAHRYVITGLAVSAISGLLLFTSDIETYWVSWVFWIKMLSIVVLLANGYAMTRSEALLRVASGNVIDAGWKTLRWQAIVSLMLWFLIAFLGVAIVNAA